MRVSVQLTPQEFDALVALSLRERRVPRDQAGCLVSEGLRRHGLLPETRHVGDSRDPLALSAEKEDAEHGRAA